MSHDYFVRRRVVACLEIIWITWLNPYGSKGFMLSRFYLWTLIEFVVLTPKRNIKTKTMLLVLSLTKQSIRYVRWTTKLWLSSDKSLSVMSIINSNETAQSGHNSVNEWQIKWGHKIEKKARTVQLKKKCR